MTHSSFRRLISSLRRKLVAPTKRKSFARKGLDIKLARYLNFDEGFFIEAGANDGVRQSNTLYFEKYQNWSGLLIEPIPDLADKCRINRPRCIVECCALVASDYPRDEIEMTYCNLMSLVEGALKSPEAERDHIAQGRTIQSISSYELTVPARTLNSILDEYAIHTIDFLSLDVEGYELEVLRGIDFDKYRPRYMLIEARFRAEIEDFVTPLYTPVDTLVDCDVLYRLA